MGRDAAGTRGRIVETAIGLLQRKGYQAVGMRDIAEQVQIRAASLYHHFVSKEALAAEAMERYTAIQAERLEALKTVTGMRGRWLGYLKLFSGMLADGPRLCLYSVLSEAHTHLTAPCLEAMRRFEAQNLRWLEDGLEEAAADGHGLRLPPAELAELIFGALEGYMLLAMVDARPDKAFTRRAEALLGVLVPGFDAR